MHGSVGLLLRGFRKIKSRVNRFDRLGDKIHIIGAASTDRTSFTSRTASSSLLFLPLLLFFLFFFTANLSFRAKVPRRYLEEEEVEEE